MLAIGACFLVCRRSGTPLGAQEIELVLEGHGRERSGLRQRCTNPPQIPHSMNERALRAWHLLKCDESGLAGWVQGNPCLYIRDIATAKCTVMGGQHTHENVHSGRS